MFIRRSPKFLASAIVAIIGGAALLPYTIQIADLSVDNYIRPAQCVSTQPNTCVAFFHGLELSKVTGGPDFIPDDGSLGIPTYSAFQDGGTAARFSRSGALVGDSARVTGTWAYERGFASSDSAVGPFVRTLLILAAITSGFIFSGTMTFLTLQFVFRRGRGRSRSASAR